MKTSNFVRRSCFVAVLALMSFAPGAMAQKASQSLSTVSAVTSYAGVIMFNPLREDRKKKKKVAAAEGGSAAMYLILAGLTCFGAMFVRSKQQAAA